MGGKNPNCIFSNKQRIVSQKLTKEIMLSSSEYYSAHSIIEDAVLAEGENKTSEILMKNAEDKFNISLRHVEEVLKLIESGFSLFKDSNQWLLYLNEQKKYFENIQSILGEISGRVKSKEMVVAINSKTLQKSMWGDNINSDIRQLSVKCSISFSKSMLLHCDFVEETNNIEASHIVAA